MKLRMMLAQTALSLLIPMAFAADRYIVDPAHTGVGFSVRHMGLSSVKGFFDEFEGHLVLDEGKILEGSATIQVKSVNTRIKQRDDHLRSADFFDAAKFPVITIKTKRVENNAGKILLIADFTMRGITKELTIPVTLNGPIKDPQGKIRIGIEGSGKLNRKDYGINFGGLLESGIALVGEEVTVDISAEAIKETPGESTAPKAAN